MRAQHVPEPFKHPRLAGTTVVVPVIMNVTLTSQACRRIAHDAQDARTIFLQHIDNNQANAIANDPQSSSSCPVRAPDRADGGQGPKRPRRRRSVRDRRATSQGDQRSGTATGDREGFQVSAPGSPELHPS